jgi:hypothetical protein
VAAVLGGGGDAQLVLGGDPADHDPVAAVHQGTEDSIVLRELCSGEDATALSEKPPSRAMAAAVWGLSPVSTATRMPAEQLGLPHRGRQGLRALSPGRASDASGQRPVG